MTLSLPFQIPWMKVMQQMVGFSYVFLVFKNIFIVTGILPTPTDLSTRLISFDCSRILPIRAIRCSFQFLLLWLNRKSPASPYRIELFALYVKIVIYLFTNGVVW